MANDQEHGLGRLEEPEELEPDFPEPIGEDEEPEEDEDGVPAGVDNNQPGH